MIKPNVKKILKSMPGVTIHSSKEIEVYVEGKDRNDTIEKTEALMDVVKKLLNWGGFSTGYGSWILRESYTFDGLAYCDKASTIHY